MDHTTQSVHNEVHRRHLNHNLQEMKVLHAHILMVKQLTVLIGFIGRKFRQRFCEQEVAGIEWEKCGRQLSDNTLSKSRCAGVD